MMSLPQSYKLYQLRFKKKKRLQKRYKEQERKEMAHIESQDLNKEEMNILHIYMTFPI